MDFLFTESLNGGLNTATDPMLLQPGELTECTNAIYRYDMDGPSLAPLQQNFQANVNLYLNGLCAINFDNGTSILLMQENTTGTTYEYRKATIGNTGTVTAFSSPETVSAGDTVVAIPFENKSYILNGVNVNRVLKQALTWRAHGLAPVTSACGASVTTTGGTWPPGAAGLGYYEYWTSEVVKTSDGEVLESAVVYSGSTKPITVNVTTITSYVTITRHAIPANTTATHWRVYRSAVKLDPSISMFPFGEQVGPDMEITTISVVDGTGTGTTATAGSSWAAADADNSLLSGISVTPSTSPGNLKVLDGVNCTGTVPAGLHYSNIVISNIGFAAAVLTDPISGIEVTVKGSVAGAGIPFVSVSLSVDNGSTWGNAVAVPFVKGAGLTSVTLGGPGLVDMWGIVPSALTLTDGTLKLRLTTINGSLTSNGITFAHDFVTMKIYHSAATAISANAFPIVQVSVDGSALAYSANGQPPTSSTGDTFEGALVLNDIANPSFIRWSLSSEPDYFPAPYFIDFETPDNDQIKCIQTLGSRCMIGLRNSLWRLNYVPTANDATFDRGSALDIVDPYRGIVGPRAGTQFIGPEGRVEMAFVSATGLHATDGYTTRPLCDALDWTGILTPLWGTTALSLIHLENNPDNFELIVWVPVGQIQARGGGHPEIWGGTRYHFNYHPRHIKENGQLKAAGPITFHYHDTAFSDPATAGTTSICAALTNTIASRHCVVYLTEATSSTSSYGSGLKRLQDPTATGTYVSYLTATDPKYVASIATRNIAPAGFGLDWRCKDVYVMCAAKNLTAGRLAFNGFFEDRMITRSETGVYVGSPGWDDIVTVTTPATLECGTLNKFSMERSGESIRLRLLVGDITAASASQFVGTFPFMTIRGEQIGAEHSRVV